MVMNCNFHYKTAQESPASGHKGWQALAISGRYVHTCFWSVPISVQTTQWIILLKSLYIASEVVPFLKFSHLNSAYHRDACVDVNVGELDKSWSAWCHNQ